MLQKFKEERQRDAEAEKLKSTKGEVEDSECAEVRTRKPVTPTPSDDKESVDNSDDDIDSEDVTSTPIKEVSQEGKQVDPKPTTLRAKKEAIASTRKYKTKCALMKADLVYPSDEDSKHQTGVDKALVGYRQKLAGYRGAYECLWKDCDYVAQTCGVVCSHLRWVHLGKALGCPYCPGKAWFQTRYWTKHMQKAHANELWYVQVELPEGPLVVDEVKEQNLFISEEHLVFEGEPDKVVKIEPNELPTEDEDDVHPPASQKRRRLPDSSSEEDASNKKKSFGFAFEPKDEDCQWGPTKQMPVKDVKSRKKSRWRFMPLLQPS